MNILAERLRRQGLKEPTARTPVEAVRQLGAVQAQDFAAAKWSLGLRMSAVMTGAEIEQAYDQGLILRTHVLRPTWHFVLPEDIRWMLALTAPAIRRFMASFDRKIGIDEVLQHKSRKIITRELEGGNSRTRQELKLALEQAGIQTDTYRLGQLLMDAELAALICSGPRRGKQFTYMLLDERAPDTSALPARETMLTNLARRYFMSHGPAQVRDFAWWSGLSKREAAAAIDLLGNELRHEEIDGKIYHFTDSGLDDQIDTSGLLLLSIFDEYTIAYNDRTDLSEQNDIERMLGMGNALTAVVTINGQVAGTWRRLQKGRKTQVIVMPFRPLSSVEKAQLKKEVKRLEIFVGQPVEFTLAKASR